MSMIDRLRLRRWTGPRLGNDGLTKAERRQYAAEYQAGAAAKPTKAEMNNLRAKMAALTEERQRPPSA